MQMSLTQSHQVDFEGDGGRISNAQSDAILAPLEEGRNDSQLLEKHLAYEQAVNSGKPLDSLINTVLIH